MKGGERMKPRVVAIYNVEQANALFKNGAKVVGFKKYNNKIAILFENNIQFKLLMKKWQMYALPK